MLLQLLLMRNKLGLEVTALPEGRAAAVIEQINQL
jgi:hypothetical protein